MIRTLSRLVLLGALSFAGAAFAGYPVNINNADAEQLAEALDGIGPAKAKAIVEYREAHGDFAKAEDLVHVKGIGPKMLDKNKEFILLE